MSAPSVLPLDRSVVAERRASARELERSADLLALVPSTGDSALDIGARDGYFSSLLKDRFTQVVALDLEKPVIDDPAITTMAGDVTRLPFADRSFDCVFCAEVLEHVPDLEQACHEITRVARHTIVIGVPYKQDLRVGRTRCSVCGHRNPPFGHLHSFTEDRLKKLFPECRVTAKSFSGRNKAMTNPLSALLMDLGGNPWGSYSQIEPCINCGTPLSPPGKRNLWQKLLCGAAIAINRLQAGLSAEQPIWIHLALTKY